MYIEILFSNFLTTSYSILNHEPMLLTFHLIQDQMKADNDTACLIFSIISFIMKRNIFRQKAIEGQSTHFLRLWVKSIYKESMK